jgi:hypothetical protein
MEFNGTAVKVCTAITELKEPEAWDFLSMLLKSSGMTILISLIVIPIFVYSLLFVLIGKTGKVSQGELWLINIFMFFISMIFGIIAYLLFSTYQVPIVNG